MAQAQWLVRQNKDAVTATIHAQRNNIFNLRYSSLLLSQMADLQEIRDRLRIATK
jgi:hypothetical protein